MCGILVVLAVLASYPFAEMGFIDDWSYIKTAEEFARTGHFVYNGWATAMLGWQIPWAALFLKLFGFSFTIARLAMLPIALLSISLFHAILLRFGISRRNAIFGSLTLGLSPLFLPLAASFMTDVSGLFILLLCLYCCQRALAATTSRASLLWLSAAAASNVAGGTVRQIVWLGALVMVPSTAWKLRTRPRMLAAGAALWALSLASVLACLHWWNNQPYSVPEHILQGPLKLHMLGHLATEYIKAALCLCLILFPVLSAWLPQARTLTAKARASIAAAVLLLSGWAFAMYSKRSLDFRVMPWLSHVLGTQSIFASTGEMLGTRPVTLNLLTRTAISLLVILATMVFLAQTLSSRPRAAAISGPAHKPPGNYVLLLLPFTLAYLLLLAPRATYSFIYDRYLLGLFPIAIVLLLKLYQERVSAALPFLSYGVLLLFASYTVAGTHDWFALNRARVDAVRQIQARGVPVTRIQGGFDFDGWTQINAEPSIFWDRVHLPPGASPMQSSDQTLDPDCRLNFAPYTPAIHPQYFLVFRQMHCLAPSSFAPVPYRNWLPPFRREIYIQRRP